MRLEEKRIEEERRQKLISEKKEKQEKILRQEQERREKISKKRMLEQRWEMAKWITAYIAENEERWKIEKMEDRKDRERKERKENPGGLAENDKARESKKLEREIPRNYKPETKSDNIGSEIDCQDSHPT